MIFLEHGYIFVLLIPILYCLYKCRETISRRIFVHLHLFTLKRPRFWVQELLKVVIVSLLLFAIASPVYIDKQNPLNRKGIDIVLAIDSSGSMRSSGLSEKQESRFATVKRVVDAFIKKRLNDNIGIVLFGDFAFIATPVTYEKEAIAQMLSFLETGMAGDNTSIGEAIEQSVRALSFSKAKSKVIVLLSDGEHNSGRISPKDAVNLAIERGIKVYTIGVGDANDVPLLQEIASKSGAKSYMAMNEQELMDVYAQIDALESSQIASQNFLQKEYYFQYILLGAFGFILLYLLRRFRGSL